MCIRDRYIINKTELIHSVDSLRLVETMNQEALRKDVIANILIEVNVAEEESKFGLNINNVIPLLKKLHCFLTYISKAL